MVGIELALDGRKPVRVAAVDDRAESRRVGRGLLDREIYELLEIGSPA